MHFLGSVDLNALSSTKRTVSYFLYTFELLSLTRWEIF